MAILGLRDTSNFVTNQRPENWRQTLLLLYPNSSEAAKAPLTALTSLMKSESTDDPVFHWWEKSLDDRRLTINEDLDNSETAITVDDTVKSAKIAKAGDILMVEGTGELVRVSTDPTADNLITVTRGVAGTSATALAVGTAGINPYMVIIGSAFEEGSLAPSGVNYDPVEKSNYTQIFRSTLEMTRTAQKTRLRTGDAVKEAKRECLEYIGVDMERAFWFGKKNATTLNGRPLRYTGGVVAQITTGAPNNVEAAPTGGLIDMNWVEQTLEKVFRFGSSEKIAFGSNIPLMALQQAVRKNSTFNIQSGIKEYGMAVTRITTPFGELVMKTHPLFNQMRGGTTVAVDYLGIANNLYFLDAANLRYRYIDDLMYEKDLTAVGLDGMKSGYLAECGIELHHATSHYIVTGITGGVADEQ
jgi:hypothetical protein